MCAIYLYILIFPERLVNDSLDMLKSGELHSTKCIYYPTIMLINHAWLDIILVIFLQAIPGFLLDFFNSDKRISLMAISRKMQSMKDVISFFMSKRLYFDDKKVRERVYAK